MDDLIKLCDELEYCKVHRSCYSNEIVCAKAKLKRHIDGDFNELLKLKAQIKIYSNTVDYLEMFTLIASIVSICISTLAFCVTALGDVPRNVAIMCILFCIFLIGIIIILCELVSKLQSKYKHRYKWIRYIEVTLEDIEREFLKNK